jgi:hypothetical protein
MNESRLKALRLWKIKAGRVSTFYIWVGADTFESAISTAVEAIKEDKPEWKEVGLNDIISIESIDQEVRMKA